MAGYFAGGSTPFGNPFRRPGAGLLSPRGTIAPQNVGLPGGYSGGSGSYAHTGGYPAVPPVQPPTQTSDSAPASPPSPGGGGLDFSTLDYSNDPILARVRALAQSQIAQAKADALRQEQQLAIGYGDPAFARSLKLGDSYAQTAEQNPFSTVKELDRTYKRRDQGINSDLSDHHNLFYSSTRANELSLSGEQNLRDHATAERAVQDRVSQIQQQLVQVQLAAQAMEIQAEQEALQRAIQRALYG